MHESDHRRLAGNAAVVYPWWLYGNDYSNPYNNNNDYPNTGAASGYTGGSDSTGVASSPTPDFNAARSTMAAVLARQQAALLASPQWAQTTGDLSTAQAEMQAATEQLKTSLLARPDYRAAIDQKRAAQERATALHEQGGSPDDQIFAAAQDDLNASTLISRIEREATASDPALLDARARLQSAAAARQALKDGLRNQVMTDPEWQAAKEQLASVK